MNLWNIESVKQDTVENTLLRNYNLNLQVCLCQQAGFSPSLTLAV